MAQDDTPLMPKATAVWLVDNTSLSFDQIAAFCRLHPLEVSAIADGDAAQGIKGSDPVQTGQLTREELARAEADPKHRLKLSRPKTIVPGPKRKAPRYTPVSKRQDRPNAILWLLRQHPELKEAAIIRLVGTTKTTIHAIRDRTHWNSANLQPLDPVTLGLCSQLDLDREVEAAAREAGIKDPPQVPIAQPDALMPVEESLQPAEEPAPSGRTNERFDPDAVFAGLKAWTKNKDRRDGED
ncbi:MAG: cell cycle transcriptional regulator TrcR [Pseudomonadota bacterium]